MKSGTIAATTSACTVVFLSGCAAWPMLKGDERPECRPQNHILYYNYQEEDLRVIAQPTIQNIAREVSDCEKAGGQLLSITIVGFPDRADDTTIGDATATARGQAVIAALMAAGLPAEKMKLADHRGGLDDINQPMRRRAEIAIEMR